MFSVCGVHIGGITYKLRNICNLSHVSDQLSEFQGKAKLGKQKGISLSSRSQALEERMISILIPKEQ